MDNLTLEPGFQFKTKNGKVFEFVKLDPTGDPCFKATNRRHHHVISKEDAQRKGDPELAGLVAFVSLEGFTYIGKASA